MVKQLRIMLRDTKCLRSFLYPIVRWLFLDVFKLKQRNIKRFGYEAVGLIDSVSEATGVKCFAAYGTMLGFVRNKGFISHDADLDFGIMPGTGSIASFYAKCKEKGFYFERFITLNGVLSEFTLRYKEISIDFFCFAYAKNDSNHYYVCAENRGEYWGFLQLPIPTKLIPITIHSVETKIPENFDQILSALYGDWHVTVKKWDDAMSPSFVKDYAIYERIESRDEAEWNRILTRGR